MIYRQNISEIPFPHAKFNNLILNVNQETEHSLDYNLFIFKNIFKLYS